MNLIGKKYGRLTVIKKTNQRSNNGGIYWECLCDCGNKILTTTNELNRGHVKSCKCLQRERQSQANQKDIKGTRFGNLIALKNTNKTKNQVYIWECNCDCGKTVYATVNSLNMGHTKSCGCLKKTINVEQGKELQEKNYCKKVENTQLTNLTTKPNKNNTSGAKGITLRKRNNKWVAQIKFQNKQIYLGIYSNFEDAVNARKQAEEKYFKPILRKYNMDLK